MGVTAARSTDSLVSGDIGGTDVDGSSLSSPPRLMPESPPSLTKQGTSVGGGAPHLRNAEGPDAPSSSCCRRGTGVVVEASGSRTLPLFPPEAPLQRGRWPPSEVPPRKSSASKLALCLVRCRGASSSSSDESKSSRSPSASKSRSSYLTMAPLSDICTATSASKPPVGIQAVRCVRWGPAKAPRLEKNVLVIVVNVW